MHPEFRCGGRPGRPQFELVLRAADRRCRRSAPTWWRVTGAAEGRDVLGPCPKASTSQLQATSAAESGSTASVESRSAWMAGHQPHGAVPRLGALWGRAAGSAGPNASPSDCSHHCEIGGQLRMFDLGADRVAEGRQPLVAGGSGRVRSPAGPSRRSSLHGIVEFRPVRRSHESTLAPSEQRRAQARRFCPGAGDGSMDADERAPGRPQDAPEHPS